MGKNPKNARNQGSVLEITVKLHRIAVSVWKRSPSTTKDKVS